MKKLINVGDMFHDETDIGCYNFVICTQDDSYWVGVDHDLIKTYLNEIKDRMSQNKSHLVIDVEYQGETYLEIQWG